MSLAVVFALASMLCAAVNDFLFKLFAKDVKWVGLYITVIGVVWSVFFLTLAGPAKTMELAVSHHFLVFAVFSGVLSSVANILLIRGMSRNEVGICATIYRLNLVPAALLAFFLVGEEPNPAKLAGIFFAIMAVFLFFHREKAVGIPTCIKGGGLWVVILAALMRSGTGICYRLGNGGEEMFVFLFINGLPWILSGVFYHFMMNNGFQVAIEPKRLSRVLGGGLVSGLLICGIVFFMSVALNHGDISIVIPVAQLSFVATAVAGIFFLGERLTVRKIAGMAMAALCILFMTIG